MNTHQSFDRLPGSYDAAERRALAAEYRGSFLPTRRPPVLDDPAEAVQVARRFAAEITETRRWWNWSGPRRSA